MIVLVSEYLVCLTGIGSFTLAIWGSLYGRVCRRSWRIGALFMLTGASLYLAIAVWERYLGPVDEPFFGPSACGTFLFAAGMLVTGVTAVAAAVNYSAPE